MESPAQQYTGLCQEPIRTMPRRKLSSQEKRDCDVKIAFNQPEYEMFLSRAIAAGKTPAVYGREVLLRSTPKVVGEINRQAWGDLGKALSNLNQITRAINTLKLEDSAVPPELGEQLTQLIAELITSINELRPKLLGKG